MYGKKQFSTFSYKLVQISPIMILVNSGAFLSISSWLCELTELIFLMIPYISSSGYPPQNAKDYGYVQVANHVKSPKYLSGTSPKSFKYHKKKSLSNSKPSKYLLVFVVNYTDYEKLRPTPFNFSSSSFS